MHRFSCNFGFMKRVIVFSLLGILACAITNAQDKKQKFIITGQLGYFQEDFRWSIAGTSQGTDPNIYSELRWQKLSGPQAKVNFQYNFWKDFLFKIDFSRSFITSGTVTDTDFGDDNRKDTLYHDSFKSNEGYINSLSFALGYKIKLLKICTASIYAGYSDDRQSLYILGDPGLFTSDLRSTYATKWNGFVIGSDLKIPIQKKIIIEPQIVYHQVNYSANADWNLIAQFKHPVSFAHLAKGFGIEPALNFHYTLTKIISLTASGKYSYWSTGKGIDTLYLADDSISTTQLNGAIRNNWSIVLGTSLSF